MYKLLCIFFAFCAGNCLSQITQLYTGTTVTINHLSAAGNSVLIGGLSGNFLARSVNEGYTLTPITSPGSSANNCYIQRIDSDTVFLLSTGNTAELYRSTDKGSSWAKRMDTTAIIPNSFTFFDANEGLVDYGYGNQILRSVSGGAAWTVTPTTLPSVTFFRSYSDSFCIMGGMASPNPNGVFLFSCDRGRSWPYPVEIMKSTPTDFCFYNKDTIFGVSNRAVWGSSFVRSLNRGKNWQTLTEPLFYNDGLSKQGRSIFVIGGTNQNLGCIAKSVDFGITWSFFTTTFNTRFKSIVFLNDSIALVGGTNGVLVRWNYTGSVFTGIGALSIDHLGLKLISSIVSKELCLTSENGSEMALEVVNHSGIELLKAKMNSKKFVLNVESLVPDIYVLRCKSMNGITTFRFVKIKD